MKGNFLTEREECFRLTSYQTKQQVVFILKYSFFSLVLPLTLLNKALYQIIARTRKYEWLTHNQAHKWSQKLYNVHFRCLPSVKNKQTKATLEFPSDSRGHLGLKPCQQESAQAAQTAAPWVGEGREEAGVRSCHDCSPQPEAPTAA